MSLFWNFTLALAILVVLQVSLTTSEKPHRDYKMRNVIRPVQEATDSPKTVDKDLTVFMIHGTIHCNKVPIDGVRPFLQSVTVPDAIAVMDTTHDGGYYTLISREFDKEEEAWLTIRHQCPMERLAPMEECAVPYFWTEISISLTPRTSSLEYNFDLGRMETYTRATCLY